VSEKILPLPNLPILLRIQKEDGRWFNYKDARVMQYPRIGEYIDPDGQSGLHKVLMVVHGPDGGRSDVYVAPPISEVEMQRLELNRSADEGSKG
jgi:hypothetical protein